jgi:hypothetical protein
MPKTWKELAEELKLLAEVILEQAKKSFQDGDINTGLLLTKEFRSAIKTAGDLNMIAQGAGELEAEFEDEDIEKALGIEEEGEDEEIEEEEGEDEVDEEDEEEDFDEDFDTDDDGELEEEVAIDKKEMEASDEWLAEQKKKIKNQVGESLVTLEQILKGIARKKT